MRKTKINVQFDSNIFDEKEISDIGEENYLEACKNAMENTFKRHFNLSEEGVSFVVKVEIVEVEE